MLKKIMCLTFTVFVLSLFTYQNVYHAHENENPEIFTGHTKTRNAWKTAEKATDAKKDIMTNQLLIFRVLKAQWKN